MTLATCSSLEAFIPGHDWSNTQQSQMKMSLDTAYNKEGKAHSVFIFKNLFKGPFMATFQI